jgi:transposase
VTDLRQRRPSVDQISRIGMDTSKHIFQLHGVNAAEVAVLRKKLRRKEMVALFEKLAPTVIAIEACGASHHWACPAISANCASVPSPQIVSSDRRAVRRKHFTVRSICTAATVPTISPVTGSRRHWPVKKIMPLDRGVREIGLRRRRIRRDEALLDLGLRLAVCASWLSYVMSRLSPDGASNSKGRIPDSRNCITRVPHSA